MNYREKMRKAIECPQFGNTRYGEWGALNLEKRKYIKRLLDELDSADNCVKRLYLKNKKQKEVIDKAIEYISSQMIAYDDDDGDCGVDCECDGFKLLDILKEVE